MLDRAVASSTWAPSRWSDWRRSLSARQAAMVRRYVLFVFLLSALGCLYLWQLNTITDLRQDTDLLLKKAEDIEGSNAVLMEQLAKWESPAYVEQQARARGWHKADAPMIVQISTNPQAPAEATPAVDTVSWQIDSTTVRSVR